MVIEYNGSVHTLAGWRSVTIKAEAEKVSEKMVRVIKVLEIDGEKPKYGMSRTGARRQEYNGIYFADREVGKNKRVSACTITE